MFITEVTFFQDDSAETFRFWYDKKRPMQQRGRRGGGEQVKSVLVVSAVENCCDHLPYHGPGESFRVETVEITDEEVNALPAI